MKPWYGQMGNNPTVVSPAFLDMMDFFFLKLLTDKSVTKAEIKLMGYLIRKYWHLGEEKKGTIRISPKSWIEEAGLSKGEIDKTLMKCEKKGWICVDTTTKPASIRLTL